MTVTTRFWQDSEMYQRVVANVATTDANAATVIAKAADVTARAVETLANKQASDVNAAAANAAKLAAATSQLLAGQAEANTVTAAAQIAALKATSTTSVTIVASGGEIVLNTQAGKAYVPGMQIFAASVASPATRNMTAIVKTYSGTTLGITVIAATGVGLVAADWNIFALGNATLMPVAQDPSMFAYDRYRDLRDAWKAMGINDSPLTIFKFD